MSTPSQRAESLLKTHKGRCFVPEGNDLIAPFQDMERAGIVTVVASTANIVKGFLITKKGWRPVVKNKFSEVEPLAH